MIEGLCALYARVSSESQARALAGALLQRKLHLKSPGAPRHRRRSRHKRKTLIVHMAMEGSEILDLETWKAAIPEALWLVGDC
jgi:hypothetical protein